MSLLSRYFMRQNMFLTLICLMLGTGLFILTDTFERLERFLESNVSLELVLLYFFVKIPMIISMILPAVFLIALVVQFNLLERSRELIALQAGGVSPAVLVRFVIVYGLFWALAQFALAQGVGVHGDRMSTRIWLEDVKGHVLEETLIKGLWFTEGNRVVHIANAYPVLQKGENVLVYTVDAAGKGIEEIIKADRFSITQEGWVLEAGKQLVPATYSFKEFDRLTLPLEQDLQAFQVSESSAINPRHLSIWELSSIISRLEHAGSNVEGLRTAWHGKVAYSCSIIVMGVLALIVARLTPNIYKALVLSLLIVFLYYALNTFSNSMGERGQLAPLAGAWCANVLFLGWGLLYLSWPSIKRRLQG